MKFAKKIKESLKFIKPTDLLSPFIFLIVLPIALIIRLYKKIINKKMWLICEAKNTARDNGFYFYKFMRKKHKNIKCYYVIDKNTEAYDRVKNLGNIVKWGSLRHWILYLSTDLNISSQKNGNPNEKFFYVIHVFLNLFNNRVFLQHGITKDNAEWLYYKNTKFKYFICGCKREYDYILKNFGYNKDHLLLTGFSRWDNLHGNIKPDPKKILIMPTWRNWLGRDFNAKNKISSIKNTTFFEQWNSLLNDQAFIRCIEYNNLEVYFYPHVNMHKYLKEFTTKSQRIKILSTKKDIQTILCECSIMITDYSSVAIDFGYMKKPVIYFQFDLTEYRKKQYRKGYYSYEKDGYGPIVTKKEEVTKNLEKLLTGVPSKYISRSNTFFDIYDNNNSERIYKELTREA